jgi:N6-adenosine-specific RNA methylase IME4
MTLEQIAALPVPQLADESDCQLWLWTTNQTIRQGYDLFDAWGFRVLAPVHWIKPSGLGNYFIHRTQTLLMGYRGKLRMAQRFKPNIIHASVQRRHSRKPDEACQLIEAMSYAPRVELFARPPLRDGWDSIGNEADGTTFHV